MIMTWNSSPSLANMIPKKGGLQHDRANEQCRAENNRKLGPVKRHPSTLVKTGNKTRRY